MRQSARCAIGVLCALILFSMLYPTCVVAAEQVTITGTVYAVDWDDKGNAIAAIISGMGGEYQIIDNAVGNELFKLNNKFVKATGVLGEDSEGNHTIAVTKYEIGPE